MTKVGLAVVTYKDNFGSALQTYATQYIVEKLGYNAECIRADGLLKIIEAKKKRFYLSQIFNSDERKYLTSYLFSKLKRTRANNEYARNMAIRHEKYVEFYNKYLVFSENILSMQQLHDYCQKYSTVLVGSDQLWRPSNIAGEYFTLEHVPNSINKVAYSTSFGVKKLPRTLYKHSKEFLSRMNHISVRENSGSVIVKDLIGKSVPVVCDPTMLLTFDEWCKVLPFESLAKGDYILCYLMGDQIQYREFIIELRKVTGYRVIGLLHGSTYVEIDEKWPDEKPFNVGPVEFVDLIRHAKYVCTDSFHCCVFSIITHTPFFVFRRDSEKETSSSNDRIYTLLDWTGLQDRMLNGNENIEECLDRIIDYDKVEARLNKKREESLNYLINALE